LSRRFVAIAAGAAAVGFAFVYAWIAWLVLNYFYVPYSNDADVPLFQQYATDILKHQMP